MRKEKEQLLARCDAGAAASQHPLHVISYLVRRALKFSSRVAAAATILRISSHLISYLHTLSSRKGRVRRLSTMCDKKDR